MLSRTLLMLVVAAVAVCAQHDSIVPSAEVVSEEAPDMAFDEVVPELLVEDVDDDTQEDFVQTAAKFSSLDIIQSLKAYSEAAIDKAADFGASDKNALVALVEALGTTQSKCKGTKGLTPRQLSQAAAGIKLTKAQKDSLKNWKGNFLEVETTAGKKVNPGSSTHQYHIAMKKVGAVYSEGLGKYLLAAVAAAVGNGKDVVAVLPKAEDGARRMVGFDAATLGINTMPSYFKTLAIPEQLYNNRLVAVMACDVEAEKKEKARIKELQEKAEEKAAKKAERAAKVVENAKKAEIAAEKKEKKDEKDAKELLHKKKVAAEKLAKAKEQADKKAIETAKKVEERGEKQEKKAKKEEKAAKDLMKERAEKKEKADKEAAAKAKKEKADKAKAKEIESKKPKMGPCTCEVKVYSDNTYKGHALSTAKANKYFHWVGMSSWKIHSILMNKHCNEIEVEDDDDSWRKHDTKYRESVPDLPFDLEADVLAMKIWPKTGNNCCVKNCPHQPCTGIAQIFQHDNFGGWQAKFFAGNYNLAKATKHGFRNDDASSMIVPANCKVVVYKHDNYNGRRVVIPAGRHNLHNLKKYGFNNDDMSSFKVEDAN